MGQDINHHQKPEGPTGSQVLVRLGAFVEVCLVALGGFLVVPFFLAAWDIGPQEVLSNANYVVILMLAEATLSLALVQIFLFARGERFDRLGWKPREWRKEVKVGILVIPVLFLSTFLVRLGFELWFPQWVTEYNPLLKLIDTPWALFLFLFCSVYVGGFKEEVQRAFVLHRFGEYLGGVWVGLALWSLFFGYGHTVQGVDNAVAAGLLGVLFGGLFIWRRNLLAPMVAHALYDIITLVLYWTLWDQLVPAAA